MGEVLIINPLFKMRNEKKRVLFYVEDSFSGEVEEVSFIHPIFAIFLSLFDGKKEYSQVINEFCYLTNTNFAEAQKVVKRFLKEKKNQLGKELLIEHTKIDKNKIRINNPNDFIINAKDINLDSDNYRLSAPISLNYNVTFRCGRKCVYCYAENEFSPKMKGLPLERVKEILDEAKDLNVNGVVFDGGEAFSRKDFLEILEYAFSKGFSDCISTKTYLNKSICSRLRDIGVDKVQVSIDSVNKKIANFLTGSSRFFDEILLTVNNLLKENIKIRIKSVLTPYNISTIPHLINFFYKIGILNFQVVPYGRSIYRHNDKLFITPDQFSALKEKIDNIKEKNLELNITVSGTRPETNTLSKEEKEKLFKKRAICSTGRLSLNVLPDGKVSICESMPSRSEFIIGDLAKQSIEELWNSPIINELLLPDKNKFKGMACFDCDKYIECNWIKGRCFRDVYHVFRTIIAPDPKCPYIDIDFRFS